MTTGKPGLSTNRKSILEGFMEKAIVFLHEPTTKEKIQHYLIDPLLNHVMDRVFPYIVLTCVLFTLLLIVAMLTFAMVFIQMRQPLPGHVPAGTFIAPFPMNV